MLFALLFIGSLVVYGGIIFSKIFLDKEREDREMFENDRRVRLSYEPKFDDCGTYSPVDNDNHHVWPWHVMVYYDEKGDGSYKRVCGGTIVSKRHIITHYQCILPNGHDEERLKRYRLVVGKFVDDWTNIGEFEQRLTIQNIEPRNVTNPSDAIALIRVPKDSIKFNYFVRPVCLSLNKTHENITLINNAYGIVPVYYSNTSEVHQEQNYAVISYNTCRYVYHEDPAWKQVEAGLFCGRSIISIQDNAFELCQTDKGSGVAFPERHNDKTKYFLRGVFTSTTLEDQCSTQLKFIRLTNDENRELLLIKNLWYQ